MKLKLADDLSLPLDAVTQTFLVVGKRGSGKSNTAARFVEQLHRARLPFVVLDPVDTWWGLKASRDGGKGLDVYVFGGRKQDLPLDAGGGALIAEVLCEHRLSMVLSVKHLSGRERSGFMVAFAQTLFQKWGGGPLHVVLEEAHELAPQLASSRSGNQDNEAAMLGAFKRLWKLGRSSGIGGTAVTQRPASLSKDITTQSEILIAHRTIGPQDVAAIGAWVKYHGERLDILAELPTLPTGEAFVWAPEFPEGQAIGLKRTTVLLRETYDSASTPKVGEARVEPKELAPVDLERLRTKLAATIEKAKADDPRELRKQIAELKRQAASAGKQSAQIEPVRQVKTVEKPVLKDGQIARAEKLVERIKATSDQYLATAERFQKLDEELAAVGHELAQAILSTRNTHATMTHRVERRPPPPSPPGRGTVPVVTVNRPAPRVSPASSDVRLPPGEKATLIAAAQYPAGVARDQLNVLTGYKRSSRDAYIQRLLARGFVVLNGSGTIIATDSGIAALGAAFQPLPEGDELRAWWLDRLPPGEQAVLAEALKVYPHAIERDAIDEATGYKRSSRDAYIQRLLARRLVTTERGCVRASDTLFG